MKPKPECATATVGVAHIPSQQEKARPPSWNEVDVSSVVAAGGGVGFQCLLGDVEALYFENRGVTGQR